MTMSAEAVNRQDAGVATAVPVSDIYVKPGFNYRRHFEQSALEALAESIRRQGVLQSLLVRPRPQGGYWLVAGERRWRAARLAGRDAVPAVVRELSDAEALSASLEENGTREDVSVGEEAMAAQRALQMCDGDKAAARALLGWTAKKLQSRLLLVHASDAVIDALARRRIHIGHAELLCQLEAAVQDQLLERIVASGATVDVLRQEMRAFTRDLSAAVFDVGDCAACPHNSSLQASLFEYHVGEGRCANHGCWQSKTEGALVARKRDLQAEVPVVWFDRECAPDSFTRLVVRGQGGVGHDQYEQGCKGCAKFGALLKTQAGHEGQVVHDLCFDRACNSEKVKAHADALAALAGETCADPGGGAETRHMPAGASQTGNRGAGKTKPKQAASNAGAPRKVAEIVHRELRAVAADVAVDNAHVRRCMEVMALEKMAGIQLSQQPSKRIQELLPLDVDALEVRKASAISAALRKNKEMSFNKKPDQWVAVSEQVVSHLGTDLKGRFSVGGALLEAQTKSGMESTLADCEFWRSLDGQDEAAKQKAFKKLMGGKREEILKVVRASGHDFSAYLPTAVSSELKNIKKVSQ